MLKNATHVDIDKKKVKFQQNQPAIQPRLAEKLVPFNAENEQQPIVQLPEEDGQQIDAQNGLIPHDQLAENELQQRDNVEIQPPIDGVHIPNDVDPLPVNVDHWVRRSTRVRRQPERFQPSIDCIFLTDEGSLLHTKRPSLVMTKVSGSLL